MGKIGKIYSIGEVIDIIWQYSRYHGNLLGYCIEIYEQERYHAALLYLFNLTENAIKLSINDYDSSFAKVISKAQETSKLNKKECSFLNEGKLSVRGIRNLLAHANLSKYNLDINDGFLYPLTEENSCKILFDFFCPIIFNIMLKLIECKLNIVVKVDVDTNIDKINFSIVEWPPEQILEEKGYDVLNFAEWKNKSLSEKYLIAENAQNIHILKQMFSNLNKD